MAIKLIAGKPSKALKAPTNHEETLDRLVGSVVRIEKADGNDFGMTIYGELRHVLDQESNPRRYHVFISRDEADQKKHRFTSVRFAAKHVVWIDTNGGRNPLIHLF